MHERGNTREWLVYFDEASALIVKDETESGACLVARILAWQITGRWLNPIRLEIVSSC